MPIVKIINHVIVGNIGETVRAYGYDFTIAEENGKRIAIKEMPTKEALEWESVGRVQVVVNQERGQKSIQESNLLDGFTDTPLNFFGFESSDALKEKLKVIPTKAILLFAKNMLKTQFSSALTRDNLIRSVCDKAEELAKVE